MKLKRLTVSVILSMLTTTCVYAEKKVKNKYEIAHEIVANNVKKDLKNPEKKISSTGSLVFKDNALICEAKDALLKIPYYAGDVDMQKMIEIGYCLRAKNNKAEFNNLYQSKSGAGDVLKIIDAEGGAFYTFKSDVKEIKNSTSTTTSSNRYITSWGIENSYPSHPTVWQYANIKLNDGSTMNAFAKAPAYSSDFSTVSVIHRTINGGATKNRYGSDWSVWGCSGRTPAFNGSYSEIVEEIIRLCN